MLKGDHWYHKREASGTSDNLVHMDDAGENYIFPIVYSDGALHTSVQQSDKNWIDMVRVTYKIRLLKEAKQREVDLEHLIRLQDVLNTSQSLGWDRVDEDDLDYTKHSTSCRQQQYVSSGNTPGRKGLKPEFSLAVQEDLLAITGPPAA